MLPGGDPGPAQAPPEPMNCGTTGGGSAIPGPWHRPTRRRGRPTTSACRPTSPMRLAAIRLVPAAARAYADFAYLAWWFKNPTLPGPIVTSSTAIPGTATSGALSDPALKTLVGDGTLKYPSPFPADESPSATSSTTSRQRLRGHRLHRRSADGEDHGPIECGRRSDHRQPVHRLPDRHAGGVQYALPGKLVGGMNVTSAARLFGGEANFVCNYPDCCVCCIPLPFSFLFGARYLQLDERLDMNGFSQVLAPVRCRFQESASRRPPENLALPSPATITSLDSFHTRNQFYGGQIGAVTWVGPFCPWFVGGQAKIAAGNVHEQVDIGGDTTLNVPGAIPVTVPGHLYAVASNSGTFSRDRFAYVPEGEVRFGYRFNANFLTYVGYNYLFITKVTRPGDQIDTTIDQRQSPASTAFQQGFVGTRPTAVPIVESSFWGKASTLAFNLPSEIGSISEPAAPARFLKPTDDAHAPCPHRGNPRPRSEPTPSPRQRGRSLPGFLLLANGRGRGLGLVVGQLSFVLLLSGVPRLSASWLRLLQFDSGWYSHIVEFGYPGSPRSPMTLNRANVAFFPGYPLCVDFVRTVFALKTPTAMLLTAEVAAWGFWLYVLLLLQRLANTGRTESCWPW